MNKYKDNMYEKINLGYIAAKEIMAKSKPRGIFATNDHIAFGIIKRLNEMKNILDEYFGIKEVRIV